MVINYHPFLFGSMSKFGVIR